ncbi:hypothetical protein BYT27DRAFT_7232843, partial [Phlegmacium glaucopus]
MQLRPLTFGERLGASLPQSLINKDANHHLVSTSASRPVRTLDSFFSNYLTIPISVAVCVAWVYNAEAEHAAHVEHIKE